MTAHAVHVAAEALDAQRRVETYPAVFQATARRVPDRVALRTPHDEVRLTWAEYAQAVERAAGALAGFGVERGDRVALLSRNRPELAIADVAALHLGAATVAFYVASPPSAIECVLRDCAPRALLIEEALLPQLESVAHEVPRVVSLESLESLPEPQRFSFEHAWRSVSPNDLAAILYTSGTTGLLKGVEWPHRQAVAAFSRFDVLQPEPDGICDISVGPFAHATERAAGHWRSLLRGSTRTFCLNPTALGQTLLEARPTYLFSAPRLWQNIKATLDSTLDDAERAALDRGIARVRAGETAAASQDDEHLLATLRARVGLDRVNRALTAAAPCPQTVIEYYHGLGVGLDVFYGLTEAGPVTMTRPGIADLGTVGVPIRGYEIRMAADGEILVRSDSAPVGYRNQSDETAATFPADGWIRTGDIGTLDDAGRLRIVERKKELLIPDHGHNIAPSQIESELKCACPAIGHVCVVGDNRPHLAALIVLEPPELASDKHARTTVAQAIDEVNATRDPRERIQKHSILPDPWLPGDELTETLKLRRRRILDKHSATISRLYEPGGASSDRPLRTKGAGAS
jgi:long-subunit acyl-CoA synthetase (AMP-forming)